MSSISRFMKGHDVFSAEWNKISLWDPIGHDAMMPLNHEIDFTLPILGEAINLLVGATKEELSLVGKKVTGLETASYFAKKVYTHPKEGVCMGDVKCCQKTCYAAAVLLNIRAKQRK